VIAAIRIPSVGNAASARYMLGNPLEELPHGIVGK
jgi:hypothetical protein